MPRSRQERPIRVIWGHYEDVAEDERMSGYQRNLGQEVHQDVEILGVESS